MDHYFRLRLSKYRFIYKIENDILLIEVIKASRGDIYKG
jgi:mRNA-degrading endonuclease RelE of RelBE toxin-antitoxin system